MSSYADAARNPNYLPPDVSHASGSSQGSLMAMWDEGLVRDISFSPKVLRSCGTGDNDAMPAGILMIFCP